ncbi:hypothetical protein EX895_001481 [Sporisorium graminicola]|uniref:Uncharacterized protein n=1 Tax=Sporisorium graminicola TaxID=280036 RepID=A0A4U7KZ75_9BASI|nr:hypothetical protein EX895_001481 [Sporisorium graminicola]TKY89696.1 hypothetical protein EX895_001481 [Sporisorium graminicola]
MTTHSKRTRSGYFYDSPASVDKADLDQLSSGSSKNLRRLQGKGSNNVAHILEHGEHIASLEGDTVDPNWIPTTPQSSLASSIGSSRFLLRTGMISNVLAAPRLPFAGSAHTLSQALSYRYSAQQQHIQASQFLFRGSLRGHTSCVNALAISKGQGRWLASAGDDTEIHIRDLFVNLRDDAQTVPLLVLKGHESNIFSLDWSAQNQYLFSTGNDSQILHYDVEHSQIPIRGAVPCAPQGRSPLNANPIGAHDDSVPQLSAHPTNPNLLLSCDDGGELKLIDIRIPHDSVAAARSDFVAGFSSVQWNPNASDGNTFAAATCGRITGSTRLYDVRQCFSSDKNHPLSSKDAVLSYHTALMQHSSTRGLIAAAAETNSICFDPQGHFLASSISRYHPTIYSVNDPDPLLTLESTVAEDLVEDQYYQWQGVPVGTPTAPKRLSSCCTIKHGSFGLQAHTGKLHYAIGSDDFRAYVFEIPDRDELLLRREFVNRRQWIRENSRLHVLRRQQKTQSEARSQVQHQSGSQTAQDEQDSDGDSDFEAGMVAERHVDHDSEVAYCAGSILRADNIVRPARIQKQAFVLCGGRSIINTALIHPTLPLILTAGIVSEIDVHSAAPLNSLDIYAEREKAIQTGGTRFRFLLPPKIPLDDTSDESETNSDDEDEGDVGINDINDSDEDQDDNQGDQQSQGEQAHVGGAYHPTEVGDSSNGDAQNGVADFEANTAGAREPRQATVQDFLTAMRNDPMYSTAAPLGYHHDRHIGTYSLSHVSPDLLPSASSASSVSGLDADVDAHTPTSSSSVSDEGMEGSNLGSRHSVDYARHRHRYRNDGYGSTSAGTSELEEDEAVERRNAFQGEDEYDGSANGKLWATLRTMDSQGRMLKQMYLFDELLRRDELRSLTAGFRKVPHYAGGEGEGRDFTCGSCEGRIDTDE